MSDTDETPHAQIVWQQIAWQQERAALLAALDAIRSQLVKTETERDAYKELVDRYTRLGEEMEHSSK